MERLHIPITGDNSNFRSALKEARDAVRQTERQVEESGMSIENMFNRIRNAAAMSLAGFSAKEFVSKMVSIRGEFQQLEVAFNTMLGSAEKAEALMQQLTRTAAITPFDLKGVTDGAKQLLAYGIAADEVNDTLVHLGDIAAGLSLPLGDLVYLYGTTMTQGRMFTQDLRQFMGRGIPLAEELAKQFGVTKDKVGELVTAGKVGADEFKKAIMSMSSEGGKFGGLMEEQSKTITGQISNIEDAIDVMFNNIGKQSEGFINDALSGVSYLVENYETIGSILLTLIATYGEYKVALMATNAIQRSAKKMEYNQEVDALQREIDAYRQLVQVKEQVISQDLKEAVAKGKLTEESAKAVETKRQELVSKVSSGSMTEEQASLIEKKTLELAFLEQEHTLQVRNATEKVNSLQKEVDFGNELVSLYQQESDKKNQALQVAQQLKDKADERVKSALEYLDAEKKIAATQGRSLSDVNNAQQEYDAALTEQKAAAKALLTAQEEANTAATELNSIAAEVNTVQEQLNTAQTELNTVAIGANTTTTGANTTATTTNTLSQRLSTIATKGHTAAQTVLAVAINGVKNSWNAMKVAMMTNPIGAIIGGLTLAIGLFTSFSSSAKEASAEVERFGESAVKQTRNLETLFAVVENTSADSKVHKDAVNELIKIYEEYGFKIDDEIDKLDQLRQMHDLVTDAIHREGEERQKANLLQSYSDALQKATDNMRDTLQEAFENAEWKGSKELWDDYDAEEFQERADELTQIIGAIIQSEGEGLAKLADEDFDAYLDKVYELHDRILNQYEQMGLPLENDPRFYSSATYPVDVDDIEIIYDYVDALRSVLSGRNALLKSFEEEKKSQPQVRKEVDYTTMSIADLAKAASTASDNVSELGGQSAIPDVDKTSIDNAGDAADTAHGNLLKLDGLSSKPLIDVSSVNTAIGQTNTLLGNMWQLQSSPLFGQKGGQFSLWGGKKPIWGTIGGKSGVQWIPDIPITDPQLLAQNEMERRFNSANSQSKVDSLLKEVNAALNDATFDSDLYNYLKGLKTRIEKKSRKGNGKGNKNNDPQRELANQVTEERRWIEQLQAYRDEAEKAQEEASIAAISDRGRREREQARFEHEQRLKQIAKQADEMKKAQYEHNKKVYESTHKNGHYELTKEGKTGWQGISLSTDQQNIINAQMAQENAEYARYLEERRQQDEQYLYDYIKEYGSIQDQRAAIAKEYEQKIANESNIIQKAALEKERDRLLSELDMKVLQQGLDWEVLFDNLDRQSTVALSNLRDRLRAALNNKDILPKDAEVIAGKILEIEEKIAERTDFWSSLIPVLKERQRLTLAAQNAEAEHNRLLERQKELAKNVAGIQLDIIEKVKEIVGEDMYVDLDLHTVTPDQKLDIYELYGIDETSEAAAQLNEAFEQLTTATIDLGKAEEETKDAQKKVSNANAMLSGSSIGDIFKNAVASNGGGAMGWINLINQNSQSLKEFVEKIDVENTDFGEAVNGFADGVSGFTNAIQSLANGDVIGAVNGILDGVAGWGKMGISIISGGDNEDELEAEIANLTESQERLAKAIEYFADKIKDNGATNDESIDYYRNAYAAEQEWQDKQRQKIDDRAGEYANSGYGFLGLGGKHSFNANMAGNDWSGWATFSNILKQHSGEAGVEHNSVNRNSIWDLTPEEMELLRSFAPKEWEALFNTDGHKNPESLVNEYIEHSGALDALTSALNEKLTGYSWDGFLDSYKSLLKDLDSTTEDFADHIQELITNALIESFVNGEAIQGKIKELYEKIAKYASEDSEGGTELTEGEINDIKAANEDIANTLLAWREAAQQAGLINTKEDPYEQEATKGAWEGMSEDTGQELNGRFTALQVAGENISQQMMACVSQVSLIVGTSSSSNSYLLSIRDMMITNNSYLEDVVRYAKSIYSEFGGKLDTIANNTKY